MDGRDKPGHDEVNSHMEQLDVVRLDFLAHLQHRRRIVLHQLDLAERRAAGLFLGLRVRRP